MQTFDNEEDQIGPLEPLLLVAGLPSESGMQEDPKTVPELIYPFPELNHLV